VAASGSVVIEILLMIALAMAGVVAAGIALLLILRRFAPRALIVIAVLGAAGVWASLAGLGITWMISGLSAEAVVLSAAAATLSAAVGANAGCWWLSARAGWIASGVTAVVATIAGLGLFVPFVFGLPVDF
jgi:hypothetical protein